MPRHNLLVTEGMAPLLRTMAAVLGNQGFARPRCDRAPVPAGGIFPQLQARKTVEADRFGPVVSCRNSLSSEVGRGEERVRGKISE